MVVSLKRKMAIVILAIACLFSMALSINFSEKAASAKAENKSTGTLHIVQTTQNWNNRATSEFIATLDRNGGSGGSESVKVTYGSSSISISIPSRIGYSFLGYNDAKSGGNQYINGNGFGIRPWDKLSDATLYAQWWVRSYKVTLNGNGGNGTPLAGYVYGTTTILPTDWVKAGYKFAGWYDNANFAGSPVTHILSNDSDSNPQPKVYWAKWQEIVTVPTLSTTSYVFTGSAVDLQTKLTNFNGNKMTISGTYSATTVGNYTATVSLPNQNYIWSDGTTGAKTFTWKITQKNQAALVFNTPASMEYNTTLNLANLVSGGTAGNYSFKVTAGSGATLSGSTLTATAANGTVTIEATRAGDANHSPIRLSKTINLVKAKVAKPTTLTNVVYSGNVQTVLPSGYNNLMNISGNAYTNAGAYTATVTLKNTNLYMWADDSITALTFNWSITQADFTLVSLGSTGAQNYTGSQIKPNVSILFNGKAVASTDYTIAYGANLNTGTNAGSITITPKGNFSGSAKVINFNILTVNQPNFSITNAPSTVVAGGNTNFNIVTTGGAAGKTVIYHSSNTAIATVDSAGAVTFTGTLGSVTITATSSAANYNDATAAFTVEVKDGVARIGDTYYNTLDEAIDASSGKDVTIHVLNSGATINKIHNITSPVKIEGAEGTLVSVGAGGGFSVHEGAAFTIEKIIFDGGAVWGTAVNGLNTNTGTNRGAVSFVSYSTAEGAAPGSLKLIKSTIQNFHGGMFGVISMSGNLELDGASVINNASYFNGGAILVNSAKGGLIVKNGSKIRGNQIGNNTLNNGGGGIVVNEVSRVEIMDSEISGNRISADGQTFGEAVYLYAGAQFTTTNSVIDGTIYLKSNVAFDSVGKVTLDGSIASELLLDVDSSVTTQKNYATDKFTLVESKIKGNGGISSDRLKAMVKVKNPGFTAKAMNENGADQFKLTLLNTSEIVAIIGEIGSTDFKPYYSFQSAINEAADGSTIYIVDSYNVDSYNEKSGTWVRGGKAFINHGITIPSGKNIVFKSAMRHVDDRGSSPIVTLKEIPVVVGLGGITAITLMREVNGMAEMISVEKGASLTLENVILDGGAKWKNGKATASFSSSGTNAGAVTVTQDGLYAFGAIIRNYGALTLNKGAILQNNENKFNLFGSANYGGGVSNIGGATLTMNSGAKIQSNYAREGGAIQNINGGKDTAFEGKNLVTIKDGSVIEDNVSHTKGAAIQTIYGGNNPATTVIEGGEIIENLSLNNLGVLTVEEGGLLEISGAKEILSGSYAIYVYNKYSSEFIKPDALGNTAYVEGIAAAKLVIKNSPHISLGKILLDDDCTEINNKSTFAPYIDLTNYTGAESSLKVDVSVFKNLDTVIAKGKTSAAAVAFKGNVGDKIRKTFAFDYSETELRVGGFDLTVQQTELLDFKVEGKAVGLKEGSKFIVNGLECTVGEGSNIAAILKLKSATFPHGIPSYTDENGHVVVGENNYADIDVLFTPANATEQPSGGYTLGVITLDKFYNIYAPANTTYVAKSTSKLLLPNTILPNDIYINENGYVTFYIGGDKEATVKIGERDLTAPGGGDLKGLTENSITISTQGGVEYLLVDASGNPIRNWILVEGDLGTVTPDLTFTGLSAETSYQVLRRVRQTEGAPSNYVPGNIYTTLKATETSEDLLKAFYEQFNLLKNSGKLGADAYKNLSSGDFAAVYGEYDLLSNNLKEIVQNEYNLLKQSEYAFNLHTEYAKYDPNNYFEANYNALTKIYEDEITNIFKSMSNGDREGIYNRAVAAMAAIQTKGAQLEENKGKLDDLLNPDDSDEVKQIIDEGKKKIDVSESQEEIDKIIDETENLVTKKRGEEQLTKKLEEIKKTDEYKELTDEAKQRIEEELKNLIDEINEPTITTDEVAGLVTKGEGALDFIFEKEKAKKEVDDEYIAITTDPKFDTLTLESKLEIEKKKDDAITSIDATTSIDDITGVKDAGILELKKQFAKAQINKDKTGSDSIAVDEIIKVAFDKIDQTTDPTLLPSIVVEAQLEAEKQRAKDQLTGILVGITEGESYKDYTEDEKAAIAKAIDEAKASVDDFTSGGDFYNEIKEIVKKGEFDAIYQDALADLNAYKTGGDSEKTTQIIDEKIKELIQAVTSTPATITTIEEIVNKVTESKDDASFQRSKDAAQKEVTDLVGAMDNGSAMQESLAAVVDTIQKATTADELAKAKADGILLLQKEDAKKALDKFVENVTDTNVKNIITAAKTAIDEAADKAAIDSIKEKAMTDSIAKAKENAKAAVDAIYNGLDNKVDLNDTLAAEKAKIDAATTFDGIDSAEDSGILLLQKEDAKKALDKFVENVTDTNVKDIITAAKTAIDEAADKAAVDSIQEQAKTDAIAKAKENAKAAVDAIYNALDNKADLNDTLAAEKAKIDAATTFEGIDSAEDSGILLLQKEDAKKALDKFVENVTDVDVKNIITAAKTAIDEAADKAAVDSIKEQAKTDSIAKAKENAKAAVDAIYNALENKADLSETLTAEKAKIDAATTFEGIDSAEDSGILLLQKEDAKMALDKFVENVTDTNVKDIITAAKTAIDEAADKAAVDSIQEQAKTDAIAKAKENAKAAVDAIYNALDNKADLNDTLAAEKAKIDAATTFEGIDSAEDSGILLLQKEDAKKALDKFVENVTDVDVKNIITAAKTEINAATSKESIDSIKEQTKIDAIAKAKENAKAAVDAIYNALDNKADLNDTLAAEKAKIDAATTFDGIDSAEDSGILLLQKEDAKKALDKFIEGVKYSDIKDLVIAAKDHIDTPDTDTSAKINAIVAQNKTEVVEKYKDIKLKELTDLYNSLADSGKYSESGLKELLKEFDGNDGAIADNAYDNLSSKNTVREIDDAFNAGTARLLAVHVAALGTGGVHLGEGETSEDFDYPEDKTDNDLAGKIESSEGMQSNIELVIKKEDTDNSNKIEEAIKGGAIKAADGNTLSEAEAKKLLKNKDLKATFDVKLVYKDNEGGVTVVPDKDLKGTYTVTILLPKDMRQFQNLQVVYMDADGNLEVFQTVRNGNYISFATTHFSGYMVMGEPVINLWWLIIMLIIIIVLEIAFILLWHLVFAKRLNANGKAAKKSATDEKAQKNNDVKTCAIAPIVLIAAIIKPLGAIATIIILSIIVLGLGAYIVYMLLKTLMGGNEPKEEEKVEELPQEEQQPEVIEEQPEEVEQTDNQPQELPNLDLVIAASAAFKPTKKDIAEAVLTAFDSQVGLTARDNETKTGLPLANTYYSVKIEDNQETKLCIGYVYQLKNDNIKLIFKLSEQNFKDSQLLYPNLLRSSFPKGTEWYKLMVDESVSSMNDIIGLFDKAKDYFKQ